MMIGGNINTTQQTSTIVSVFGDYISTLKNAGVGGDGLGGSRGREEHELKKSLKRL